MSHSFWLHGLEPTRLFCAWNSPGKNTRVVAIPVSRGSSQPRDQTWVSCTAGRFFTIWAWNQNGLSYMHGLKFRANLLGCLKTRSVDPFWSAYTLTGLDSSSRPLEWTLWSWEKFQAEENFVIIDFLQVLISTDIDIDIEVTQLCPTLCDPWTVAYQAPPSMKFSRQEYWSVKWKV